MHREKVLRQSGRKGIDRSGWAFQDEADSAWWAESWVRAGPV